MFRTRSVPNAYRRSWAGHIWYKNPRAFRLFAEKYFEDVKPELVAAGLATE
jgi:hypothetical protein